MLTGNILFIRSVFNGLLTDLFASENSKQNSLSVCWLLRLEMRGYKWHPATCKLQSLRRADCHAKTAKYSSESFYTRRTSLLRETVSMIQPDIFKSGKSCTKLRAPLEPELISSHKVNLGALYWPHVLKLWSYTSYLCSSPTNSYCLQAEIFVYDHFFAQSYSLFHIQQRQAAFAAFAAVITFIPQRNWGDVC